MDVQNRPPRKIGIGMSKKVLIEFNQAHYNTLSNNITEGYNSNDYLKWARAWYNLGLYLDDCISEGIVVDSDKE